MSQKLNILLQQTSSPLRFRVFFELFLNPQLSLNINRAEAMDHPRRQPICAQEALDVLNCVTESSFDQEKCIRLLKSLRECVLNKKVKKFSLSDQNQQETEETHKEKS